MKGIYLNCIHDLFEIHIQLGVLHFPWLLSDSYTWNLCRTGLFILPNLAGDGLFPCVLCDLGLLAYLCYNFSARFLPGLGWENVIFASARCREHYRFGPLSNFQLMVFWPVQRVTVGPGALKKKLVATTCQWRFFLSLKKKKLQYKGNTEPTFAAICLF